MDNHCLVVKIGTTTVTGGTPRVSTRQLVELVRQIATLRAAGKDVIVVSSGAMAAGREKLGLGSPPKGIPAKQMLAAVGQPRLMAIYEQLFGLYDVVTAQVLLTRADLANRSRYLNSRNTLNALLGQRVVPVINENDTVAVEEIRVGDNDNLAALVANLVEADLLVLLTDQAGLYTADPRRDAAAKLVEVVAEPVIPDALWQAAGGSGTGQGTGGMVTKLQAADLARRSGTRVVIASGTEPDVLLRLAAGERVGTTFQPTATAVEGRKRYILTGSCARGKLAVDDGAAAALAGGGSLLPVGLRRVEGSFDRGDPVRVQDAAGREIARGLAEYPAADLRRIAGHHSHEIESILGYVYAEEVIHRNHMVLL